MAVDWQAIAMAALCALSGIIWWEVRQLRHAKHHHAGSIQYALMCVAIIASHVKVDLPPPPGDDE